MKKEVSTHYTYGTAGFRMHSSMMGVIVERVGMFAGLLSQAHSGQCVGVMITASHNPVQDNGCKIVGTAGEMLEVQFEGLVTRLVNCGEGAGLRECLEEVSKELKEMIKTGSGVGVKGRPPTVLIGIDTRPSGPALFQQCRRGVEAVGGRVYDDACGISNFLLTTPQLHSHVKAVNANDDRSKSFAELESAYIDELANAFVALTSLSTCKKATTLLVDAANGVGGEKVLLLKRKLLQLNSPLDLTLIDDGSFGLNENCGADFVKTQNCPPLALTTTTNSQFSFSENSVHYASLDGDADRIVFYHFDHHRKFHLFDGDRMAVLIAEHFKRLLDQHNLSNLISLGVVQTAYANGASTRHIRNLGIPVVMTRTGVKNLHHHAKQFDLGVYFEANGHGTVLFSPKALHDYPHLFAPYARLINPLVGDALSDMLLAEAILRLDWNVDMGACLEQSYRDLPNHLTKLSFPDRGAVVTGGEADEVVLKPEGIQARIEEAVGRVGGPLGRAFVRPSGTEDVVRIYAEAATPQEARDLATAVMTIVKETITCE